MSTALLPDTANYIAMAFLVVGLLAGLVAAVEVFVGAIAKGLGE